MKGPPGAGKTRFALQLTDDLRDSFAPWYISLRMSEDALIRYFPALAPQVLRRAVPRSEQLSPQTLTCRACTTSFDARTTKRPIEVACPNCGELLRAADRTELDRPIGNMIDGKKPVSVPLHLPEVELAYDAVDENLWKSPWRQTLIVFDPMDALDDKYDIRHWRLLEVLQKDLVENTGASTVYVFGSSTDGRVEYLVDGVVGLSAQTAGNAGTYSLTLEKLRGREIHKRRYALMIRDG